MRGAVVAVLLILLAGGSAAAADVPAPTPQPSVNPEASEAPDVTVESNPETQVKTLQLQGAYTGATYGPGSTEVTQIISRLATVNIGKSVLRLSPPRFQTINGVDSGFTDTVLFYLVQNPIGVGRKFVGLSVSLPTASSRPFGTGKWMIGPAGAYVWAYKPKSRLGGILIQTLFSVAGSGSRANQSLISVLPFGTFRMGGGWFWKLSEAQWVFDLQRGATLIPFGIGIGRTARLDGYPVLVAVSDEVTVVHANVINAPKSTVRFTLTMIVRDR